ncbi:hypothetical protein LIER_06347 [Lithospermum erythrorhizon]|uniref:Uncharacterized protein n=1 Tax=Lithospermum erythrorhizon TaxID=34254 RepID=A0AAV3P465_LITER
MTAVVASDSDLGVPQAVDVVSPPAADSAEGGTMAQVLSIVNLTKCVVSVSHCMDLNRHLIVGSLSLL